MVTFVGFELEMIKEQIKVSKKCSWWVIVDFGVFWFLLLLNELMNAINHLLEL